MTRFVLLIAAAALFLGPSTASAAVDITFYSREYGSHFPHAFITLSGTLNRSGERIDANYGFTATHVTPAILLGSVRGEIISADARYIASSDPHFRFTLSDAEYDAVMRIVEEWRSLPQPSYNLNRQNCVFFVARVAAALGMRASTPAALMKKPRSYAEHLTRENRAWLERRRAAFLRQPAR
ncbi:MAG: hypothetical protein ACK4K7_15760 [Allosphingosinicella sp.]|uniref:hypothetical protein n=1 Tax=Allosphingosinicella sp. TaxID=2823234 RepID=UPI0039322D7B